jgi:DNA-binding NarL/FixJ family response regulator
MRSIAVSSIDPDPCVSETLRVLLKRQWGFEFLQGFPTVNEAMAGLRAAPPDVLLIEVGLPGIGVGETIRELCGALPHAQLVVYTAVEDRSRVLEAFMAGAVGWLSKAMPPSMLLDELREVHVGGAPLSRSAARKVVEYLHEIGRARSADSMVPLPQLQDLTAREREVMIQLAKGFRYKEIAETLGITGDTVRGHLRNIYEKLGVTSRTEAVVQFLGSTWPSNSMPSRRDQSFNVL